MAEGGAALAKEGLQGVGNAGTNVLNKTGAEGAKAVQKIGDVFKKK